MTVRLLVPLDESRWSESAAQTAIEVARRAAQRGEVVTLTLLHVVNVTHVRGRLVEDLAGLLGFEPVIVPAKVEALHRERGEALLERAAAASARAGVQAEVVLDQGAVVDRIVERSAAFDLLVLGSRGETEARFPGQGGSTAGRILRRAPVTALVVPEAPPSLDRMALAWDGSEGAGRALVAVRRLAELCGSDVVALHASEGEDPLPDPLDDARAALGGLCTDAIRRAGLAREVLPEAARDAGCGTLALGYRGRGRLRDVFLGRTTEWLVGDVDLALLVAR